jgi:C4-dicarboxylate-specific signal transduction histidine kinase
MPTFVATLALILALAALGAALWSLRAAPRRQLWEMQLEQADQREMLEKLLTRHRSAASAENVQKARAVKAEKATLREQAEAVLAAAGAAPAPAAPQLTLLPSPAETGDLAYWRKRAGLAP